MPNLKIKNKFKKNFKKQCKGGRIDFDSQVTVRPGGEGMAEGGAHSDGGWSKRLPLHSSVDKKVEKITQKGVHKLPDPLPGSLLPAGRPLLQQVSQVAKMASPVVLHETEEAIL